MQRRQWNRFPAPRKLACAIFAPLLLVALRSSCPRHVPIQMLIAFPPTAQTSCGEISGQWEHPLGMLIAAYRGIKFGKAERWMPSTEFWPGAPRIARQEGPACIQWNLYNEHGGQSEDCLYLNVFAPGCAPFGACSNLPVVVFPPGGGLVLGDNSGYAGLTNFVAAAGDIVMVVCQHRLGSLGFMALPECSARDPRGVSGNYGFLDYQLCLRWVQEHVAAFGGDASNVTLMGQSSGGTLNHAHLAAPGSEGLFHRVIALSGAPGSPKLSQASKEEQDRRIWLPRTGCAESSSVLDCLLGLGSVEIAQAIPEIYTREDTTDYPVKPGPSEIPWAELLHADGVTIAWNMEEALAKGPTVPLLLQTMGAELSGVPHFAPIPNESAFERFLYEKFAPGYGPEFPRKVRQAYGAFPPEEAAYSLDSETGNACGYRALGQIAASQGTRVYLGIVRSGPAKPAYWKSCEEPVLYPFHGWEVAAVFGSWNDLWFGCEPYQPTSQDLSFASFEREAWLAFIRKGQLPDSMSWNPLDPQKPVANAIGYAGNLGEDHDAADRCNFWAAHNVSRTWYWIAR